jgi:malate permease and related proteins
MFMMLLWSVICVFLMMAPGYISARNGWLNPVGVRNLSRVFLYFIYPCLIFSSITQNFTLRELGQSWILPVCSLGVMVVGYIIGLGVCLILGLHRGDRQRAFLFQSAINNYSFFPLAIVAQLGGSDLVALLIFSTIGGELAVWTLGIFIVSDHRFDRRALSHLFSPPLVALYAAVIMLIIGAMLGWDKTVWTTLETVPYYLHSTAKTMGQCTVPLAMIISGARLADVRAHHLLDGTLWVLSALRLVAIPFAIFFIIRFLPLDPDVRTVILVVAVMPVSMASMVISELYGGDKELINGSVLLTHIFALVSIPTLLALFFAG